MSASVLATGGGDGCVKVWDLVSRRPVLSFTPHGAKSILSLSALPQRERLVSCGRDGTVKTWDINALSAAAPNPGGVDAGTGIGVVSAWNHGPEAVLDAGFGQFCNACTDSMRLDANVILAPAGGDGDDSSFVVWDLRADPAKTPAARITPADSTGGMLCSLAYLSQDPAVMAGGGGGGGGCGGSRSDESGPVAVAGYENGVVKRLCLRTRRVMSETATDGESPALTVAALAQPGKQRTLIAGGGGGQGLAVARMTADAATRDPAAEGTAKDSRKAQQRHSVELPSAGTSVVRLRSDGRLLFTGHWDCSVRLWDTKRLKPLAVVRFHRDSVYAGDFAPAGPAGHWLATGGKDGCVALWDLLAHSYSYNGS
jgi:WD40 repeat protein